MTGRRRAWVMVMAFGALVCSAVAGGAKQAPQPAEARLGAALHQEQVEGNLAGAMATYLSIVDDPTASRPVAARALLQLAGCYEKLGRPEATATLQRIVERYGDTGSIATAARAKLASMQAAGATPFKWRSLDAYFQDAEGVVPSPDGRFAAYLKAIPGKTIFMFGTEYPARSLVVRNLENGRERVLVDPKDLGERYRFIQWSPDGRSIAYQAGGPKDLYPVELRVVSLDRATSRGLDRSPAFSQRVWSPDSQRLVYGKRTTPREPFDVHVVNVATGELRSIGHKMHELTAVVRWSPDSQYVALVPAESYERGTEIAIVNVETRERRIVTVPAPPQGGRLILADWLPSGEIAFRQNVPQSSNDRFLVPASGGDVRKICEGRGGFGGDGCGAITTDGRYQIRRLNVSGGGRVVFRDLATGEERPLTPDSVVEQVAVLPTRNGRLIAFRSDRDGRQAVYAVPTDRIPVDRPVWLADLETAGDSAGGWWTPDGLVLRLNSNRSNIYRLDMDPASGRPTGSLRRLTQDSPVNDHPEPSPDGRRIAYVSRNGGRVGIAVMNATGTDERVVFKSPPDLMPIGQNLGWRSPDELVLFLTGGQSSMALLNVATEERVVAAHAPMVGGGKKYMPAMDEIVHWARGIEGGIRARSVTSGSDRMIATLPGGNTVYFVLSPDGQNIIYSTANWDAGEGKPIPGDMRIRPIEGGSDRVLVTYADSNGGSNHMPVSVSPNGRHLTYQDPNLVLMVMNLETTDSWPLLVNPPAGIDFEWADPVWSPDGSYVVFMGRQARTEWRMFQGVTYDAVVRLIDGRASR